MPRHQDPAVQLSTQPKGETGIDSQLAMQQELEQLLKENLKVSRELYRMIKKIKRWTDIQRFWGFAKLLIIVAVIVSGIIYLPPLVSEMIGQFKELVSFSPTVDNQELLKQLAEQLNRN